MIKSMTGFAQRDIGNAEIRATLTLKAYNNRYLDISISLPPYLSALEARLRSVIGDTVAHGKVEAAVRVRELAARPEVRVDRGAAASVADALRDIRRAAGIRTPVALSDVMAFEGVVSFERNLDADALWNAIADGVVHCVQSLDAERIREGEAARADIERALASIVEASRTVAGHAAELESTIRSSLERKFREVLGDAMDEGRVLAEIASYLAKHTINEELVRLESHIASFKSTMDERACGKKLDFICQEMNREVNTIGSKNMLVVVGKAVVTMKDAIENIREQVRNIE